MGSGKRLTNEEKTKISTYYECGMSGSMIAKKIGRSENAVCKLLRDPIAYSMQNYPGKAPALSDRAAQRMISVAILGEKSTEKLCNEQEIPLTTKRVQQILSSSGKVRYEKRKATPYTNIGHQKKELTGGFGAGGTTPLAFIEGRQDAKSYIKLLKLNMKPHGEDICGDSWYFQQNNATSLSFSLCIPS